MYSATVGHTCYKILLTLACPSKTPSDEIQCLKPFISLNDREKMLLANVSRISLGWGTCELGEAVWGFLAG